MLIVDTFTAPARALADVATSRRFVPALLAATVVALLHAGALASRLDVETLLEQQLAAVAAAAPEQSAAMTPHEREEALASKRKLATVGIVVGGLFGPALQALGAALALWLAFKVAALAAGFRATFAVVSYGFLPLALAKLLSIPSLLARSVVTPDGAARLLPSNLGALMPAVAHPAWRGLLTSIDVFSLWSLALVTIGLAAVTGASWRRAGLVAGVMWLAYVAVFGVALAAIAARATP